VNDPIPIFAHESTRPRRRVSLLRCLIVIVSTLFLIIAGGFFQFVSSIPHPGAKTAVAAPGSEADAIVVLTGARDRISIAMGLLEAGKGARLLISGVNEDITREVLETTYGGPGTKFACCVDLGFQARTTDGNASETALWAKENSYGSLIVVTSDYHMPRSLAVLASAMPDVTLIAHPVASNGPSTNRAFRNIAVARLLVSEYAKYVVTLLRTRLG